MPKASAQYKFANPNTDTVFDRDLVDELSMHEFHSPEQGVLYINPAIVPPDMIWSWMTRTVNGVLKENNIFRCEKEGWTPVLKSQHPALRSKSSSLIPDSGNDYEIRGDMILMQRSKRLHQAYLKKYAEKNTLQKDKTRWAENIDQNTNGLKVFVNEDR